MDDQNSLQKPALTLDEELDVLEAVYKIGKEKGLELLRPEQVKKLKDAGRMAGNDSERIDKKKSVKQKIDRKKIQAYVDVVVIGLELEAEKEASKTFKKEDWESMEIKLRNRITFPYFLMMYGLSPVTMRNELLSRIEEKGQHA